MSIKSIRWKKWLTAAVVLGMIAVGVNYYDFQTATEKHEGIRSFDQLSNGGLAFVFPENEHSVGSIPANFLHCKMIEISDQEMPCCGVPEIMLSDRKKYRDQNTASVALTGAAIQVVFSRDSKSHYFPELTRKP